MKVLFGYQNVLEVIKNDVISLVQDTTETRQETHKEEKKKDFKALFLIHKCIDTNNFEKFGDNESSKQAWEILEKAYAGADKAKAVRLQTHKHQLELIQMMEKETINDFMKVITRLVNQVKAC